MGDPSMRMIKYFLKNFVWIGIVASVVGLGWLSSFGQALNETREKALIIVKDPHSPDYDFLVALKALDSYKDDTNLWLKIATDEHFDPDRRRRFVKHFFDHFITAGMSLEDITRLVDGETNWISFDRIEKPKRFMGPSVGWAPEALNEGASAFIIPVLSTNGGHYNLIIILSLDEDASLEDFKSGLLHGKSRLDTDTKLTIAGCSTYDSDEEWKRFGGPWPW